MDNVVSSVMLSYSMGVFFVVFFVFCLGKWFAVQVYLLIKRIM